MSEKTQYKTKQKEELIEYLETVPGKHITVNDVCDYFRSHGKSIGTTTVYRQMEKLVDEGVVNKYILDASSPACFEYIDRDRSCHETSCFHCKCEKCGRLVHLHCEEILEVHKHIESHHGFVIDPHRTVFYGVCENCREKDA